MISILKLFTLIILLCIIIWERLVIRLWNWRKYAVLFLIFNENPPTLIIFVTKYSHIRILLYLFPVIFKKVNKVCIILSRFLLIFNNFGFVFMSLNLFLIDSVNFLNRSIRPMRERLIFFLFKFWFFLIPYTSCSVARCWISTASQFYLMIPMRFTSNRFSHNFHILLCFFNHQNSLFPFFLQLFLWFLNLFSLESDPFF